MLEICKVDEIQHRPGRSGGLSVALDAAAFACDDGHHPSTSGALSIAPNSPDV